MTANRFTVIMFVVVASLSLAIADERPTRSDITPAQPEEKLTSGERYDPKLPPDAETAERGLCELRFGFGSADSAFARQLYVRCHKWEGKRWSSAEYPSSCSYGRTIIAGKSVPGLCLLLTHRKVRWGEAPAHRPRTRHYTEKLKLFGFELSYPWVEAIAEWPISSDKGNIRVFFAPTWREYTLAEWERVSKVRVTLRFSPESNWYYVKLNYLNQEAGPGWVKAPNNEVTGERECALNWTDQKEKYSIQWKKRIESGPSGGFGECHYGPNPNLVKKGWNGEGPEPVDE